MRLRLADQNKVHMFVGQGLTKGLPAEQVIAEDRDAPLLTPALAGGARVKSTVCFQPTLGRLDLTVLFLRPVLGNRFTVV